MIRGHRAETLARRWLCRQGLKVVTRNLRCRFGEIDLVMQDGPTLVFVEVRWRRRHARLSALESVDERKQRKLLTTAQWFLGRQPRFATAPVRFDVIAIDGNPDEPGALQWIRDAFRPGA